MLGNISALLPARAIAYRPDAPRRRIDWFYREYAAPAVADVSEFVGRVNSAYYRHSAHFYDERYVADIVRQYRRLCKSLGFQGRSDLHVVDIGGGTGFEYEQLLQNRVGWKKYFFIEPDAQMIDQFQAKTDLPRRDVEVIHGVFEDFLPRARSYRNKLILLNSCLHHVIDVRQFLDRVKEAMHSGDYFAICHEPYNPYSCSPLMVAGYLWRSATSDFLLRKLNLRKSAEGRKDQERWRRINEELLSRAVIHKPMPPLAIRRVIDYWVGSKGDWRGLGIPRDFNEGFWSPADLKQHLGPAFQTVYFRTYRHLGDPGKSVTGVLLNRLLEGMFTSAGSVFFLVFQKR
jgi:SAM-dependent methyltransferase